MELAAVKPGDRLYIKGAYETRTVKRVTPARIFLDDGTQVDRTTGAFRGKPGQACLPTLENLRDIRRFKVSMNATGVMFEMEKLSRSLPMWGPRKRPFYEEEVINLRAHAERLLKALENY